jgi:2-polyprenyl-6-methoxyphenol hydroxylase-like FAD-dependent oxidoreductase
MDTQVLIVGAGPTGLTLAIDLGLRGVPCMLIEQKEAPQFLPKMERCNARSMEIYRRMGIADRVRAAGLPAHCPMDIFVVFSLVEPPLVHHPHPSVAQAKARIAKSEDASEPLEPYQLISQYTLEPLLKSIAESLPSVTVRYGCELIDFTQDVTAVSAQVRSGGATSSIRSAYMVGCDGGNSLVRRRLGIALNGEANIQELRQALYYCEDLYERIPIGKGRHYHVVDAENSFLIVQDSTRHLTLHSVVENDADMARQFERVVAMPVVYDMLYVGRWRMNLLLADRYGEGRVFLAGDAVHLVIPTGGLGMNTGVGETIDLSWKLAATLQGWGGPGLLASYELERRQVGERNVAASGFAARGRRKWRKLYRPDLREPSGVAAREELTRAADLEQRKASDMIGAELGYRYVGSPLIAAEPGEGPAHEFMQYVPTTWPGARLPHVWLADGSAVQDRIGYGHGYTLLRLGGTRADTDALEQAFAALGAPLQVLELDDARPRDIYGYDLLLLRPDMHVVWRGNAPPLDPRELAARATGHYGFAS